MQTITATAQHVNIPYRTSTGWHARSIKQDSGLAPAEFSSPQDLIELRETRGIHSILIMDTMTAADIREFIRDAIDNGTLPKHPEFTTHVGEHRHAVRTSATGIYISRSERHPDERIVDMTDLGEQVHHIAAAAFKDKRRRALADAAAGYERDGMDRQPARVLAALTT